MFDNKPRILSVFLTKNARSYKNFKMLQLLTNIHNFQLGRWNLNGRLETRTVAPQAATTALLVAGLALWVCLVGNRWQESLLFVQGETVTSHVKIECCTIWVGFKEERGTLCLWCKQNRGNFVKEVSVTVLVQGKETLLLLKVCESCIE